MIGDKGHDHAYPAAGHSPRDRADGRRSARRHRRFRSPGADSGRGLLLLRPHHERTVTVCMVAGALLVGIGLGWAGCLGWNGSPVVAVAKMAPKDASLRQAEAKSPGKAESIRKQAPLSPQASMRPDHRPACCGQKLTTRNRPQFSWVCQPRRLHLVRC